jgi:hypothetical protein
MKNLLRSMIVATFAFGATPALSDQVFEAMQCKLVGDKSDEEVIAAAKKWLAAARTVPGGKELRLSIHFPVAGGPPDADFVFVLRAPSFETWGRFWDNYAGSAAEAIDEAADEITQCSSGRLYGGVDIQPE